MNWKSSVPSVTSCWRRATASWHGAAVSLGRIARILSVWTRLSCERETPSPAAKEPPHEPHRSPHDPPRSDDSNHHSLRSALRRGAILPGLPYVRRHRQGKRLAWSAYRRGRQHDRALHAVLLDAASVRGSTPGDAENRAARGRSREATILKG